MENQLMCVRGIYQDGKVVLLSPFKPTGRFSVLVTFLKSDETGEEGLEMIQQVENVSARRVLQKELAEKTNLSKRETDILRLLVQGKTNTEIANNLGIGNGTVRNYVSTILSKFNVDNRTKLVTKAKNLGLID
ncbi:MAG: hypothetical protein CL609_23145 [Anaerolineaceae bacterium]|nr:hypothetical protein [Anaerolineaceae bacterium]